MTGKRLFKKYEYAYDEYYECYICPNNEVVSYSTTDEKGYKQYKSNPDKCRNCPLREQCTKRKNCQKIITRHMWEEYNEQEKKKMKIRILNLFGLQTNLQDLKLQTVSYSQFNYKQSKKLQIFSILFCNIRSSRILALNLHILKLNYSYF